MTDPMHVSEALGNVLRAMGELERLGPFVTRLKMGEDLYRRIREEAAQVPLDLSPWVPAHGVPVDIVQDLPPMAYRIHWSDGRVATRYRKVLDPRVLQVRFRVQPYGGHRGPERHGLGLQVRRIGWVYADVDPRGCSWEGPRASVYLPGLAALAERAGMTLAPWQNDYLGALVRLRAAEAYRPSTVIVPKGHGLGGVNGL